MGFQKYFSHQSKKLMTKEIRKKHEAFVRNDILFILVLIVSTYLLFLNPFFDDQILGGAFLWSYEKTFMVVLISYLYIRIIRKKNLDILPKGSSARQEDRAVKLAVKWLAFGFGGGFLIFLVLVLLLVEITDIFEDFPGFHSNAVALNIIYPAIVLLSFVVVPAYLIVRLYRNEKESPKDFTIMLIDGLAYVGIFAGIGVFVILDLLYLILSVLDFIGISI